MGKLSWKQQTVLLTALRGPDAGAIPALKIVTRWIRSIVVKNAAPKERFMRETEWKPIKTIIAENTSDFAMLSVHYFMHLMHGLEIIGHHHPDLTTRAKAKSGYFDMCEYMHVHPETKEELDNRLEDRVDHSKVCPQCEQAWECCTCPADHI